MKILNSQIIDLTKHVFLQEPAEGKGARSQFAAGKVKSFSFLEGTVVTWWYTEKTFKIIDNISFVISKYDEFSDCDLKSIRDIVSNTLREVCADKRIFNIDEIFFSKNITLFESRSTNDIGYYSSIITSEILDNIRRETTSWCVVYSAPRLLGGSFFIPSEGIHIINKHDESTWIDFNQRGYVTNFLDVHTGVVKLSSDRNSMRIPVYNYLFITEESGTLKGSKFSASLKLKLLFAVIFSVISKQQKYVLMKSSANPQTRCLQFPHSSSLLNTVTLSDIGALLPYYIKNYLISSNDIETIIQWYNDLDHLDIEFKARVQKCGHFINHAMNSEDVESFINYFISLDALFGQRNSVEKSIILGVERLPDAKKWNDKIVWLFELRSELVHGGSRYIEEWPRYNKYYRHFSSEPLKDIEKLAFSSLLYSPQIGKSN